MEVCVPGMAVVNLHGSVLIHPRKEREGEERRRDEKGREEKITEQNTGTMGSHSSRGQHIYVPRSPERQGSSSWFACSVPDSLAIGSYGLQGQGTWPSYGLSRALICFGVSRVPKLGAASYARPWF